MYMRTAYGFRATIFSWLHLYSQEWVCSQEAEVNSSMRLNEETNTFIHKQEKEVEIYLLFQSHGSYFTFFYFLNPKQTLWKDIQDHQIWIFIFIFASHR